MNAAHLAALTEEQDETGYLKAGFLGFAKTGKSFTSCLLAIATKQFFNLSGPIAMFDTETGSTYLKPIVRKLTGEELLAKRRRSFDDLMRWADSCIDAGVSVAIVDSMTHPWRELCETYLATVNEHKKKKGWRGQDRIEFQDWGPIKARWAQWSDFYINAPLHIVIAGRAGNVYENEEREGQPGKRDLVVTGVRMNTEKEFGFEPSLLVELERDQIVVNDRHHMVRTATVLGDRFGLMDGATVKFPSTDDHQTALAAVLEFFRPHLEALVPGAHAPVNTEVKSEFTMGDDGEDWQAERKRRVILCEEIMGEILKHYPGSTVAEKSAKAGLIEETFGTRSWSKVEDMNSRVLRQGLESIRSQFAGGEPAPTLPPTPGESDG